ncbi:protease complex subunit PrcB family protein [Winogradskyella pulchriflava]|uniref:Protease complex subunit PrcB family protein n=1 Tax=Winogradskyella pulchriflava TaxID=1110688 RepID=A0ABV6Q7P6_9FLAO
MIHKTFSIFILLFALNCKSTQNQEKMQNEAIVLIGKGNLYGSGDEGFEKQNMVINNTEDWNNVMAKMNSVNNVTNGFSETKIDFSKFTVIAVFDEVKTSGGHSLELDIKPDSEKILVEIIRKSPDGMATSVMTQPYYIAKIMKSELPIEFK